MLVFLAAQGVAADGVEITESEATITETSAKPDTKLEEVLASNTETQPIAESAEKQTNPEVELPQTSSQSESSALPHLLPIRRARNQNFL